MMEGFAAAAFTCVAIVVTDADFLLAVACRCWLPLVAAGGCWVLLLAVC